jgi:hypothetical protein
VVTWQSVSNRAYFLERASRLAPADFTLLATNLAGQPGATSYTDTQAVGSGPFFYRVGVEPGTNQPRSGYSLISFAWLQTYGLPADDSADFTDPVETLGGALSIVRTCPKAANSVYASTDLSHGFGTPIAYWQFQFLDTQNTTARA